MNIRNYIPFSIKSYVRRRIVRTFYTDSTIVSEAIGNVDKEWRNRIDLVKECPDNKHIERVSNAGEINGYLVTMHNGVKVTANGYYGAGILNMLIENAGVHEPQEERVFDEILAYLPAETTMLELGSYWGFYSLSLLQKHPKSQCYLVEPDSQNFESGKINFKENGRLGHFTQAYIGEREQRRYFSQNTITVDTFCSKNNIEHLHILHADIQGYEAEMLRGAKYMLESGHIDYLFISTHSNSLHETCCHILTSHDYEVLVEASLDESYSVDGLIVAKGSQVTNSLELSISKSN